jgi:hypothetical protein
MPSATAAAAVPANESLEFAGVNVMGDKVFVSVYDKQLKKGRWISVGGNEAGITVLAYDPRHEQIVVKSGEVQRTLTLRKAVGVINGPTPVAVMPPSAGFNVPPGVAFQKIQPPPPGSVTEPVAESPAPAPVAAPAKPEEPAKPLSVARQEEEARMLVSDLLEIGMAQRKAYEEAQKKAAGGTVDQPATPAAAQPAASTPPAPGT